MKQYYPVNRIGIHIVPNERWDGISITKGGYNGYILVPVDHPWFGKDYNEIEVDVHGGLTFARAHPYIKDIWVLGFDTAHYGDDEDNWTFDTVLAETLSLRDQAAAIANLMS